MSNPAPRASRERGAGAVGAVQARQPPQFVVAERLDAEAQTIDARRAVARQPLGRDGFGIRFERDLAIGGDVERSSAGAR